MSPSALQWIASVALGRMLFCLAEGTALAVLVGLVVRGLPQKNSKTRFLLWLSALLATVMLPLLLDSGWSQRTFGESLRPGTVTLPVSVAIYLVAAWAGCALAGLARVALGLWHLERLRKDCREVAAEALGPELLAEIARFREVRRLKILVSANTHGPAAIGFFRPAIILPDWLVKEGSADDLRHVVLHELAHLRRRDDWTNLLQKVIKVLLFFHPAVWWMERNLTLDREMACDEAVLERTGSPRNYAESLARVAEKSFLRRQLALAQAAVGRVRQLSLRVTRILDPQRPAASRTWKLAVPAVVALALISGVGLSWVAGLVNVGGSAGSAFSAGRGDTYPQAGSQSLQARMSASRAEGLFTSAVAITPVRDKGKAGATLKPQRLRNPGSIPEYRAAKHAVNASSQSGFVLLVATQETFYATPSGWQVSVRETRWLVPARFVHKQKPRKT